MSSRCVTLTGDQADALLALAAAALADGQPDLGHIELGALEAARDAITAAAPGLYDAESYNAGWLDYASEIGRIRPPRDAANPERGIPWRDHWSQSVELMLAKGRADAYAAQLTAQRGDVAPLDPIHWQPIDAGAMRRLIALAGEDGPGSFGESVADDQAFVARCREQLGLPPEP